MYQQLKEKLWAFIVHNNPDLMFDLQEEYNVTKYLEEKVSKVMPTALKLLEEGKDGRAIHELCMNEMTAELKPSRYKYISRIIRESFPEKFESFREAGMLTYETVTMVGLCKATFDNMGFSQKSENDISIKEAIIQIVSIYLYGEQAA